MGSAAYRAIIPGLPGLLQPSGVAVLELGIGQLEPVATMARQAGLTASARPDFAEIPRALVLRRAAS